MKFPITRESLQAFDYAKEQEELRKEEVQKILAETLERFCTEFKQAMLSNSKEKKFVWHSLNKVRFTFPKELLPQFIEKLQYTFVGCDVIIDPLKTYIIIDWS
jgi:hypothetical protein